MFNFLVRRFIKNADQVHDPIVRGRYGAFAGVVGIFLNLCLFTAKLIAGWLTSSIAITADAFNNLSDAGSSVVTLVGFKMAGMPSDNEHPFGHGRIEYLSGLTVSVAILLVGLELARSSVGKIMHPTQTVFSGVSVCILLISIAVKVWMCWFNRTLARRISSSAMHATAMDSLTDAVATSAVLIGVGISYFWGVSIDGWMGMLVALFILYSGYSTARDSLSPLLGQAPDAQFVKEIEQTVLAHPEVSDLHDLIVHDYGPGRCIISLHAEMPCNADILAMHDAIDRVELELRNKFGCDATIHMDPIAVDNEEIAALHKQVSAVVEAIDPAISIHDFRMVTGASHTNLIFDVLVPHRFRLSDAEVLEQVRTGVSAIDPHYFAVMHIDQSFLE